MAFDHRLDLDAAFEAATTFVAAFEQTARQNPMASLRDGAARDGLSMARFQRLVAFPPCDMLLSNAFVDTREGK